ncbi:FtsX-like permease family protein [Micromonospora sp. NPDC048887]|uniref:ABC transporter permease n=1 Tax=Micromonospora sp. NPDC048887 TaxID=3155614 RepID=UPI0033EC2560
MLKLAIQQGIARPYRLVTTMAAVVIVMSGFLVLAGTSESRRLAIDQFVSANSRGAYDLLVRPAGSRSRSEVESGLVRPGYLIGHDGGITLAQWKAVSSIAGVDAAAPAGVLGYIGVNLEVPIALSSIIDRTREQQVVRVRPSTLADAGLTRVDDSEPRFAYVTTRPVAVPRHIVTDDGREGFTTPDNRLLSQEDLLDLGCAHVQVPYVYLEKTDAGDWVPICGTQFLAPQPGVDRGSPQLNMSTFSVFQALPDGRYKDFTGVNELPDPVTGAPTAPAVVTDPQLVMTTPLWLPIGVIDPAAEADLVDLPASVRRGRYLAGGVGESTADSELIVQALVAERLPLDEQLLVETALVDAGDPVKRPPRELLSELTSARSIRKVTSSHDLADVYHSQVSPGSEVRLDRGLKIGPASVSTAPDGHQQGIPVSADPPAAWSTAVSDHGERATGRRALQPLLSGDVVFRSVVGPAFLDPQDVRRPARVRTVGTFEPNSIRQFSEFAAVPLELYDAGLPALADGRQVHLGPNSNPTSYLALPPSALISVENAVRLTGRDDVVGALRVRVSDVDGVDGRSRERVTQVAEQIAAIPGLEVDVTLGSSPEVRSVNLPSGQFGRPPVLLDEMWPRKGAALTVVRATDEKTVTLFGLVTVMCFGLLAGNMVANLRGRRRELAVLSVLGWRRRRVVGLLVVEATILAFLGGLVTLALGGVLVAITALHVPLVASLAALAIVTVMTALIALVPALRAARRYPSLAPDVRAVSVRRTRGRPTPAGLAWTNALSSPGRTLTAATAVALTVIAGSALLAIRNDYAGTITGSLLGNEVQARVSGADAALMAMLLATSLMTVANVIYVGLRERAMEINTLRAVGWTESSIRQLAGVEGAIIGGAGALLGAVGAVIAVGWPLGGVSGATIGTVVVLAAVAVALTSACGAVAAAATPALSAATMCDEG